ncbi:MAG TPA: YihY/virulence factor BrkB family protein [Terracidiphilus sp.]|nr:YihY/virulence factor BrkB family protein [Terracidiphilus sp.]
MGQDRQDDLRVRGFERRIWSIVAHSPLESLWNLKGIPMRVVAIRTWESINSDRIFGHAAELAFYFLFALFPTLFCAGSAFGMVARSAHHDYDQMLNYLSFVIPGQALAAVLNTFNATAAAATSSKVTFGTIATLWSASVGISAIQDTMNAVYKINDRRSYIVARMHAIGLTILLSGILTLGLASMLGGDLGAAAAFTDVRNHALAGVLAVGVRVAAWTIATSLLALAFAVIYYWAPDLRKRRWHWFTPGGAVGISGWLIASVGFRIYLHFFNNFSYVYGSLGAVIILLTWFYISGLMLLVGAEINSEIEAAAAKQRYEAMARPHNQD